MFEYDNKILKVYGFNNISYVDNNNIILVYKNKKLLISGNNMIISNLLDKSIEIRGIINSIVMERFNHD